MDTAPFSICLLRQIQSVLYLLANIVMLMHVQLLLIDAKIAGKQHGL